MYRILAISLLALVVWVQTPVVQLLKVHTLVEHYYEHKTGSKKLSVADFLYMHYANDQDDPPLHPRDMQLPFKQYSPTSFVVVFFAPVKFELHQTPGYSNSNKPLLYYKSPYHATEILAKIWQPPRA